LGSNCFPQSKHIFLVVMVCSRPLQP
jgi:hypothetical protein